MPSPPLLSSALYETEPVGCEPGAAEFLNAVVEIGYAGSSRQLLEELQKDRIRISGARRARAQSLTHDRSRPALSRGAHPRRTAPPIAASAFASARLCPSSAGRDPSPTWSCRDRRKPSGMPKIPAPAAWWCVPRAMVVSPAMEDFRERKRRGERITALTAYDYPTARLLDESGIDIILVRRLVRHGRARLRRHHARLRSTKCCITPARSRAG